MKNGLLFLIICCSYYCGAQHASNIWHFGHNAGLKFNTITPTPLSGQVHTPEGCSSISDPVSGMLLLYTDGTTVWDRDHNPMPGSVSTPLKGDSSSTQSSVIVPKPGSNNLYYIFTTPSQAGSSPFASTTSMCYSIVDLNSNGGNGDIVSVNNILIDTSTEKIAVVGNCEQSAYWIVGHKWNCDSFYAYKLTASGLSAPIKSKVGIVHQDVGSGNAIEAIGYMKFSNDGRKLGLVTFTKLNTAELFDFDFNTGIISNPITDVMSFNTNDLSSGLYGCSFSPDNSKFYVSYFGLDPKVFQYDLNAGSTAAILASKTVIMNSTNGSRVGALQNGPDGKMYMANYGTTTLSVINNPNVMGSACNYVHEGQNLGNTFCTMGLPNIVESFVSEQPHFQLPPPNAICIGDTLFAPQPYRNNFSITPATNFIVNDDSSMVAFFPPVTTEYTVVNPRVCKNDTTIFTVYVSSGPVADFIFDPANPLTDDIEIILRDQSTNGYRYAWFNSDNQLLSTSSNCVVPNPGEGKFRYRLVVNDLADCVDTTYKCVTIANSFIFIPNTFSPNGDGLNDVFRIMGVDIKLKSFKIFNRYGEQVFETIDMSNGWDGSYKSEKCDIGTYHYIVKYENRKGEKITRKGNIILLH
jgi:gliding motility-associated-like protein